VFEQGSFRYRCTSVRVMSPEILSAERRSYITTKPPFVVWVIRVLLKAGTPANSRTYLAAMNAPRIIVKTVSWTGLENFFLSRVKQSETQSICIQVCTKATITEQTKVCPVSD